MENYTISKICSIINYDFDIDVKVKCIEERITQAQRTYVKREK
ncbi:hypothetical protein [Lachnospira multipara]|nr:hypothetical protein [Lachnospira multipara]